MPIILQMEAGKTWIKHFNVSEKDLSLWQKQMPKGQNLLQYALEAQKIEQNAYLEWATARFQLPQVKDQFFLQPLDFELWQKSKDWYAWRGDLFPISEWNGILYVACYAPELQLQLPQPHVFVLGSVTGLKMGWDQIQSMQSILENSPALGKVNAPDASSSAPPVLQELPPLVLEPKPSPPPAVAMAPTADASAPEPMQEAPAPEASAPAPTQEASAPKSEPEETAGVPTFESFAIDDSDINIEAVMDGPVSEPEAQRELASESESAISIPEGLSIQLDSESLAPESPENILQFDSPPPPESADSVEAPEGINLQVDDFSFNFEIPSGLTGAFENSEKSAPVAENSPDVSELVELEPAVPAATAEPPVSAIALEQEPLSVPPPPPPSPYSDLEEASEVVAPTAPPEPMRTEKQEPSVAKVITPPASGKAWSMDEVAASLPPSTGVTPLNRSIDFDRLQVKRIEPVQCRPISPQELESARSELAQCQNSDEVAATCFRQMSKYFNAFLFFVFRQEHLIPWRWSGNWLINESTKPQPIALVEASLFRICYQSNLPYHGYCVSSAGNDAFLATWNSGNLPAHATLVPVRLDGKLIAMVLGISKEKKVDAEYKYSLRLMEDLADRVSQAFKRIQLRKAS